MANSVDPDQGQSDLGLHRLHLPFVRNFGVWNFRIFTIHKHQQETKEKFDKH